METQKNSKISSQIPCLLVIMTTLNAGMKLFIVLTPFLQHLYVSIATNYWQLTATLVKFNEYHPN